MSFFNSFLKEIGISDLENKTSCSMVFGKAAMIVGVYKIVSMQEYEIVVCVEKINYKIWGNNLKIKTMSKGEIIISGNVVGVCKIWLTKLS